MNSSFDNTKFLSALAQQIASDQRTHDGHVERINERYTALKTAAEDAGRQHGRYLSVSLANKTLFVVVEAKNIRPSKRYSIYLRVRPGAEGFEGGAHGSDDFTVPQATPDLDKVDDWLARAIAKAVCRARADEDAAAEDAAVAERVSNQAS